MLNPHFIYYALINMSACNSFTYAVLITPWSFFKCLLQAECGQRTLQLLWYEKSIQELLVYIVFLIQYNTTLIK